MAKKTVKQQIMEDIKNAGAITILRNTMASGEVLEATKTYKVPAEISVEDAFELVAVVRKATIKGKKATEKKEEKK